ncbi:MAG: family 20 glycosylhydrolase, partial [Opitutales bacterium]|nr:family 20 glycosylhydrolase [Opitutales bacterium]
NQLQLYTEHTFAYRNHQTVWENASPLTAEEIQSLDAHCYNRYIELVPNQNTFGHMDRWLRHNAYRDLAECPNGYTHPLLGPLQWGGTLKPNEESIAFIRELYDELLPNFCSNRVNVGGDEPWELGQGWSEKLVKKHGKHRVYINHLLRIHDLVDRRGKTMQLWGDIVLENPELARELPKNCLGNIWGYEANHPFDEQCQVFESSGIPFYVAPGTSAWNSIGGRIQNSLLNIEEACRQAVNHGAKGMLLTDWGDFGHHQFPFTSYHAIIGASALSWNQTSNGEYNLDDAVDSTFLRGTSSATAKAIFKLSKIVSSFQYKPDNRTLLNDLLMSNDRKLKDQLDHTNARELKRSHERLCEFISLTETEKPFWAATDLVSRELVFTSELLKFAAIQGLKAFSKVDWDLQEGMERLI